MIIIHSCNILWKLIDCQLIDLTTHRPWQLVNRVKKRQLVDDNSLTMTTHRQLYNTASNDNSSTLTTGQQGLSYSLLVSTNCKSMSCQVDELAVDEFSTHRNICTFCEIIFRNKLDLVWTTSVIMLYFKYLALFWFYFRPM